MRGITQETARAIFSGCVTLCDRFQAAFISPTWQNANNPATLLQMVRQNFEAVPGLADFEIQTFYPEAANLFSFTAKFRGKGDLFWYDVEFDRGKPVVFSLRETEVKTRFWSFDKDGRRVRMKGNPAGVK